MISAYRRGSRPRVPWPGRRVR